MSFDTRYPNRKDHRAPYYGSKAFDRSCRCNGGCPYCAGSRQFYLKRIHVATKLALKEMEILYNERIRNEH